MKKIVLAAALLLPTWAHAACPAPAKLAGQTHVCSIDGELGGQLYYGSMVHSVSRTGAITFTWTLFEGSSTGGAAEAFTGTATISSSAAYASACSLSTASSFSSGATSQNLATYVNNGNQLEIRGVRSDGLVFKGSCFKP